MFAQFKFFHTQWPWTASGEQFPSYQAFKKSKKIRKLASKIVFTARIFDLEKYISARFSI